MLFLLLNLCLISFCLSLSDVTTLNGFIDETRDTLRLLQQENLNNNLKPRRFPSRLYNLTDAVHVQQRSINLIGFSVDCTVLPLSKRYMQIRAGIGLDTFIVAINLPRNETATFPSFLRKVQAESFMTGTEAMLLIHHILSRLGIKRCYLTNGAKFRYEYRAKPGEVAQEQFIPLISLRCIEGRVSDWYEEFGYSNGNKEQIAREMQRVHNSSIQTNDSVRSLGPWLQSLWDKSDKNDFHRAYKDSKVIVRFTRLLGLRDNMLWSSHID